MKTRDWCVGADSSLHREPESGECPVCTATIAKFEAQENAPKYDPNGPQISRCECGDLVQYWQSHEPWCQGGQHEDR